MVTKLKKFQRDFIRGALAPGVDVAALSLPRGNGKSFLAGHILTRCLTPGNVLFQRGAEYVLCAGSIEQARLCFRFVRADLEPTGEYRFLDSVTRIGAVHKSTNTRLRVMSSNGRTAMGLVGVPLVVADEPGSWETSGGELMWDALTGAIGKPESPLRIIAIGTLAPATSGWWHDLIADGSKGSTYVQSLKGDPAKWDSWAEIKRVNPLVTISPDFRRRLREERGAARADTRLKARFLSYRLNVPSGDESTMLLTVDDWARLIARPVPERHGRPIVGLDLGGGRAWSAATAVWQSGRVEALAVAPGVPDLGQQEQRDRQPAGTYQRLAESGRLEVAEGLRVPLPSALWDTIISRWGQPALVICDRFRLAELQDVVGTAVQVEPRVSRWSEAAADIRALRKLVADGPLAVEEISRPLMAVSLSTAQVKSDDQGSTRLVKRGSNNTARDDVAAALVLAAGAFSRTAGTKPRRLRSSLV